MYNLKKYNTFGVVASTENFKIFHSEKDIIAFLNSESRFDDFLIIGEGSNILFVSPLIENVCKVDIKGIDISYEDDKFVYIIAGAGELWRDFADFCISKNWSGVENLVDIPGTVGASAVQNIGAYGAEVSNVINKVFYIDTQTKEKKVLSTEECNFGYRNSIFKNILKGNAFITKVEYKLCKNSTININYKELANYLSSKEINSPTVSDIALAIKNIRGAKLPDVNVLGSAGSFFKNPLVDKNRYEELKSIYPEMPSFHTDGCYKIPAAWLIEKAGLKGYRVNDAGIYDKHSLILVNYGNASGREIGKLAIYIINHINNKFGIILEPEVIFV